MNDGTTDISYDVVWIDFCLWLRIVKKYNFTIQSINLSINWGARLFDVSDFAAVFIVVLVHISTSMYACTVYVCLDMMIKYFRSSDCMPSVHM